MLMQGADVGWMLYPQSAKTWALGVHSSSMLWRVLVSRAKCLFCEWSVWHQVSAACLLGGAEQHLQRLICEVMFWATLQYVVGSTSSSTAVGCGPFIDSI
jgi:hypothetical protein